MIHELSPPTISLKNQSSPQVGTEQEKKPYVNINTTSYHAVVLHGDFQISHLWKRQTKTIIDVRVMNKYVKSYISYPLDNVMETKNRENKRTEKTSLLTSLKGNTSHPLSSQ